MALCYAECHQCDLHFYMNAELKQKGLHKRRNDLVKRGFLAINGQWVEATALGRNVVDCFRKDKELHRLKMLSCLRNASQVTFQVLARNTAMLTAFMGA